MSKEESPQVFPVKLGKLTSNQVRRALRLLESAERTDAAKVAAKQRARDEQARNASIQAEVQGRADALTSRARSLGLPLTFLTQTTRWSSGVPDPEIYAVVDHRLYSESEVPTLIERVSQRRDANELENTWSQVFARLEHVLLPLSVDLPGVTEV